MAHGEIYVLAGKIDMMKGRRHTQIDIWMLFGWQLAGP